jgi:hypothetical protein
VVVLILISASKTPAGSFFPLRFYVPSALAQHICLPVCLLLLLLLPANTCM